MVAKINVGNTLFGSISYNDRKLKKDEAKVLLTNKIFNPIDVKFDKRECIKDFESYLPSHYRTENPVITISLNPHPDDRLSDTQFADIAEEYMQRLGYGNQPYIVYKHTDLNRHHIHIISLRVDENGKKINDKFEHRRSKKITQLLEEKYGLTPAEKRKRTEIGELKKVDVTKGDLKRQVGNVVKDVSKRYHFQSFNEYRALLSLYNITAEEVKGEVYGKPYYGVVYSATDDTGNKVGNPFKSSIFGKSVGYKALQDKFESSKEHIRDKSLARKTRTTVQNALNRSTTREQFISELKSTGIDVLFRVNDSGRMYGVTYIDHNNNAVLNGSRLGRELSANALTEWFDNPQQTVTPPTQTPSQQEANNLQSNEEHQSREDEHESSLGLFDFDLAKGGDDPEEERFRRRMQRKKKKSRRL